MASLNLELYKKLYLIRKAESLIIENYKDNEMKTPMHMSAGSEAIEVGVCMALSEKDQVFGTYRSHGLYLAKGGDINKFFGEMSGKITGAVKGKGGSMHLSAPKKGLMATSAVVASTIPIAVGAAYANKIKQNKHVTTVFFGDGAIDEGAFWESLNMACLMKLPIIFVCEDNGLAVHTSDKQRHGYNDISEIVSQFRCNAYRSKSTDVEEIYDLTKKALRSIKIARKPSFLHLKYYRYLEHVGVNEDFEAGYRDINEFKKWEKLDPLDLQRKKLASQSISQDQIKQIEEKVDRVVLNAFNIAKRAKFPPKSELLKDIFYEKN